jgi:hypothetical protein
MFHEASKDLYYWLVIHGYDPFVVAAVLAVGFLFLQRKDILDFKNLDPHWRGLLRAQIIGCALVVVSAFLVVTGILPRNRTHKDNSTTASDTAHCSAPQKDTVLTIQPSDDSLEHSR